MVIIVLLATEQHHWNGWELSTSVKDNLYLQREWRAFVLPLTFFLFSCLFSLVFVHGRVAEAVHQERHVHFLNTTSFSTALYSELPGVCEARHPAEWKITILGLSENQVWSGNCTSDYWECFKRLRLQTAWSNYWNSEEHEEIKPYSSTIIWFGTKAKR